MSLNDKSRLRHSLLAALLSLILLDTRAGEIVTAPTFGEQMREIVQAHDRGEITYKEMMALRDMLSKQHTGGSTGSSQAGKLLRKFPIAIKKPAAEIPISPSETGRPSYTATIPPDKEPAGEIPMDVTPTPGKPILNCSGIRKFMLRCLRRPYSFKTDN